MNPNPEVPLARRLRHFNSQEFAELEARVLEAAVKRICSLCHCGLLEPHPELDLQLDGWRKCPICGFCRKDRKEDYPSGKV